MSSFHKFQATNKKILIVNEETDLNQEYSFTEFLEFSRIVIDLKKTTNIKKNISSIDLFNHQQISTPSHPNPNTLAGISGSSGHLLNISSPIGADPISVDNIICNNNKTNNNNIPSLTTTPPIITTTTTNNGSNGNLHGLGLSNHSSTVGSHNNLLGIDTGSGGTSTSLNTSMEMSPFSNRKSFLQSPLSVTTSLPNTISRSSQFQQRSIYSDKSYWIDLEGLEIQEISVICKLYNIHPLTYEDIISDQSTEKCEEFSNYIFISTSEACYSTSGDLVQTHIYMILFSGLILTFHTRELDCFENISRSFYLLNSKSLPSAEWIVASFFDSFNEIYNQHAEHLFNEVKVLEDFTLKDEVVHQEIYFRLGKAARKSTNLLSFIFIKIDILSTIVRQNQHKETKIYLHNIKDKTLRIKQRLKLSEELLENINTLYISKVSLLLNEESHSLNMSMHKFSAITVIFLPLTLISGIFGMNLHVPGMIDFPESPPGMEWFTGILLVMAVLGLSIFLYFKKLGWL